MFNKILKLIVVSIILVSSIQIGSAQNQYFDWAKSVGGQGGDGTTDLVMDSLGNLYLTGWYQGAVDFDPDEATEYNLNSNGGEDIYIQKLDSLGDLVWIVSIGGSSDERGRNIAVDSLGNVYITGSFQATVDFDPHYAFATNLTSNGGNDIFILKLDVDGNFLWANSMGSTEKDYGMSISVDTSGNVYTAGCFYDIVDFDPGASSLPLGISNLDGMFVQKLDTDGNLIWAKSTKGVPIGDAIGSEHKFSLLLDNTYNVYITGDYQGTVDFDPGIGVHELSSFADTTNVFVLKLSNNGDFEWVRAMEGPYYGYSMNIACDDLGNIYTTGCFLGDADFISGAGTYYLSNPSPYRTFVQKMSPNGDFIWANTTEGTGYNNGSAIITSLTGNIYVIGYFMQTVDFNPDLSQEYNLTSNGNTDIFIQKLDSDGNFLWAKSTGGSGWELGTEILEDKNESLFITGIFEHTVDFAPGAQTYNLSSNGMYDYFIQKLSLCSSFSEQICMVTVDTITGSNLVVWEKTEEQSTSKYRIYRESGVAGIYDLLTEQNYDDMSEYLDLTSNPTTQPYKYKISTVDSVCNDESLLDDCLSHTTIHLQASVATPSGYNLQWTNYEGYSYSTFNIYGREAGAGNFGLLHQSAYGSNTWTDNTVIENMEYVIAVDRDEACIPTSSAAKAMGGPYYQSTSNIEDEGTIDTKVSTLSDDFNISLFPNPNNGQFMIGLGETVSGTVQVMDVSGKVVLSENFTDQNKWVNDNTIESGIYLIKLNIEDEGVHIMKMIVE